MRILVLLPSLTDLVGGIQTYSQALVGALRELGADAGWQVDVLGLHDRVDRVGTGPGRQTVTHLGFGGSKWRFTLASLKSARHADVILLAHIHFAPLLHLFRWIAPRASCRISAHGIEVWRTLSHMVRSAAQRADEIWTVSDYTRGRMIQENPVLAQLRYAYLPNTLGPSYPPARHTRSHQELGLAGKRVLLCVSRLSSLESYKNVEAVLRSMPPVVAQFPDSFLVIVGPGDDRPRLESIVHELNIGTFVRFTGKISEDDLQSYLSACDLFVLPSTGEGFGIVYLEAMFHGKACIGARAGGAPEVIQDSVTGLLVDPDHMSELPRLISTLLADDARRAAMGAAGKARLDKEFSAERFRQRLSALLSPKL